MFREIKKLREEGEGSISDSPVAMQTIGSNSKTLVMQKVDDRNHGKRTAGVTIDTLLDVLANYGNKCPKD